MFVGQIVYDLVGVNGYTSTKQSDPTKIITGQYKDSGDYARDKIKIQNDLVATINRGNWNKIGIQAKSGALFYLNNRPFYMGNTEVYQLDESDILIESLSFADSTLENIIIDYIIR